MSKPSYEQLMAGVAQGTWRRVQAPAPEVYRGPDGNLVYVPHPGKVLDKYMVMTDHAGVVGYEERKDAFQRAAELVRQGAEGLLKLIRSREVVGLSILAGGDLTKVEALLEAVSGLNHEQQILWLVDEIGNDRLAAVARMLAEKEGGE